MRSKISVVLQILLLGFLIVILTCCDFQAYSTDNRTDNQTASVPYNPCGMPSCSAGNCGPSGCGPSGCGPSGCEPPVLPDIEQPAPAQKESPPKPPKLLDGEELPSSTIDITDDGTDSDSDDGGSDDGGRDDGGGSDGGPFGR